jgi:hypothetical protein
MGLLFLEQLALSRKKSFWQQGIDLVQMKARALFV